MAFEFKLPDIGEGIHEGEIVQWLVKPGDYVREDQAIVEIMTDKVTAEIPSPVSGVIQELRGKEGEVVKVGAVITVIDEKAAEGAVSAQPMAAATAASAAEVAAPAKTSVPKEAAVSAPSLPPTNGKAKSATAVMAPEHPAGKALAAPATRKMARQLGIELSMVQGSGPLGRITPEDLRRFQQAGPATTSRPTAVAQPTMARPAYQSGGEKRVPFTGLRRKIAEHLVKAKQTAPHFSYVEEVDMSRLMAVRDELLPIAEDQGVRLSYLPFIMKAVIEGLKKYPVLNSTLDENTQELVYKYDYHLGIAVATDQGLIVPVIKHADQKNLFTLAREISDIAGRARTGKLGLDDIKGGTFTVTSIGSIGGMFGIPIINYPEVAILGVNKIEKRPVVRNVGGQDQIVIRDMMYLSISCDHRIVDGAEAAHFVKDVISYLEAPSRLLMEEI
ncbi:MAG TPA: dihydrolipoamide acetyltransferase family protein [Coleofasciculaceae cyanobacterium]|jgi:pyruvate dehydrogenase E2 component (dihydrolipoamide acetyltransferase)